MAGVSRSMLRARRTVPEYRPRVSVLTRMKVDYGLALNTERARKLAPMLDAFFSTIATPPFDEGDAKAAAAIRATLKTMGQPIGAYDALIAGAGQARGVGGGHVKCR